MKNSTAIQIKAVIHNMFLQRVIHEGFDSIKEDAKLGEENRNVFNKARRQGRRCRDNAAWIGLERQISPTLRIIRLILFLRSRVAPEDIKSWEGKLMVESPKQIAESIRRGEFKEDHFVDISHMTHRICAPSDSNKTAMSAILWTKSDKDDDKPDWSKVVRTFCHLSTPQYLIASQLGGFVYNLDEFKELYSMDSSQVQDDIEATMAHLK